MRGRVCPPTHTHGRHFHSLSAKRIPAALLEIQLNELVGASSALRLWASAPRNHPPPLPSQTETQATLFCASGKTNKSPVPAVSQLPEHSGDAVEKPGKALGERETSRRAALCTSSPSRGLNAPPPPAAPAAAWLCPCGGIGSRRPCALLPAARSAFCLSPEET